MSNTNQINQNFARHNAPKANGNSKGISNAVRKILKSSELAKLAEIKQEAGDSRGGPGEVDDGFVRETKQKTAARNLNKKQELKKAHFGSKLLAQVHEKGQESAYKLLGMVLFFDSDSPLAKKMIQSKVDKSASPQEQKAQQLEVASKLLSNDKAQPIVKNQLSQLISSLKTNAKDNKNDAVDSADSNQENPELAANDEVDMIDQLLGLSNENGEVDHVKLLNFLQQATHDPSKADLFADDSMQEAIHSYHTKLEDIYKHQLEFGDAIKYEEALVSKVPMQDRQYLQRVIGAKYLNEDSIYKNGNVVSIQDVDIKPESIAPAKNLKVDDKPYLDSRISGNNKSWQSLNKIEDSKGNTKFRATPDYSQIV